MDNDISTSVLILCITIIFVLMIGDPDLLDAIIVRVALPNG